MIAGSGKLGSTNVDEIGVGLVGVVSARQKQDGLGKQGLT